MISYLKTKAALVGGAALLGTVSLAGAAQAADATATVYNGSGTAIAYATSYGANGAVKVCDSYSDGYGASTDYIRVSGASGHLVDNNGHGTCVSTGNSVSNPIREFRVCSDRPNGGDVCSPYVSTKR